MTWACGPVCLQVWGEPFPELAWLGTYPSMVAQASGLAQFLISQHARTGHHDVMTRRARAMPAAL
eukprot:364426-Chlamydomonas_euryale.AAC.10